MDIATLFRFRQTSSSSRHVVDSSPEYRAVTTHALNALCALLRSQVASHVTLLDFYHLLCEDKCASCTLFGSLVHIPTWTRYCFRCLQAYRPETNTVHIDSAKYVLAHPEQSLAPYPIFKSLNNGASNPTRRISLACFRKAYIHENPGVSRTPFDLISHRGPYTSLEISQYNEHVRWAVKASCAIVSYCPQTDTTYSGYACIAESFDEKDRIHWQAIFTRDSFLDHFKQCYNIHDPPLESEDEGSGPIIP